MNIPIYRAKWLHKDNIASKEYINGYVIGFYFEYLGKHYIRTNNSEPFAVEIDPTTIAIHFSDMLDNQGNKIFASLSEEGRGGDIVEDYIGEKTYYGTVFIQNGGMTLRTNYDGKAAFLCNYTYINIEAGYNGIKIIGIQK